MGFEVIANYIIKLFGPENVWGVLIALTFLAYIKFHDNEHKTHLKFHKIDDERFNELKETVKEKFETIQNSLSEVRHILDKYTFKFESDEQKKYREKVDGIILRIRSIGAEMAMFLKQDMLEAQGKDKTITFEKAIQLLADLRERFRLTLIKDGYDAGIMETLKNTGNVIFALMNDKVKHIVEIATDESLNGSKPYAIEAMIKELEISMLDRWEKMFISEMKK